MKIINNILPLVYFFAQRETYWDELALRGQGPEGDWGYHLSPTGRPGPPTFRCGPADGYDGGVTEILKVRIMGLW